MKNKNRIKLKSDECGGLVFSAKGLPPNYPCEIVFNNGWIHVSESRPTKRDADESGCVIVWDGNGIDTWPYEYAHEFNWWQPCPKAPKKIGKKGRR